MRTYYLLEQAPFVFKQPAPVDITSILTNLEALLKVRKSYISETASRKTGQNVIQNNLELYQTYIILTACKNKL
jgi:hypothetical protein